MTPELALRLGRAIAHVFRSQNPRPRIVIGKDTRLSNYMFEAALQAGICSMGVDAVQLGVLPTPGIAFMTTGMRADAGVVPPFAALGRPHLVGVGDAAGPWVSQLRGTGVLDAAAVAHPLRRDALPGQTPQEGPHIRI